MEEIDNIILHSLRQNGCEIEENATLSSLDPSTVIQCVSRCLRSIDSTLDLPRSMPSGMAQRYGVTLALAEKCTEIGFRGDIGYQTFLHSNNTTELRRVLMFLIDKLPKEESDSTGRISPTLTDKQKREQEMRQMMTIAVRRQTTSSQPQGNRFDFKAANDFDGEKSIYSQTTAENIWSTIITYNASGSTDLGLWIRPKATKLTDSSNNVPGDSSQVGSSIVVGDELVKEPPKEEDPIDMKMYNLDELRLKIKSKREERGLLEVKIAQLQLRAEVEAKELNETRLQKKIKERTLLVLDNPEENIQKLQKMIENGKEKRERLELQWEEHRTPLQTQIDAINEEKLKRSSKTKVIEDQINDARQKQKVIRSEMETKSQMYSQLLSDLGKVNQKIDRSAYTSRIFEIIGNIRKQKMDIDKILRDTREVQKSINNVTGKLERQFTVTDDLLFSHAKKDEQTKRMYKLFLKAHSDCGELARSIQETGKISREIRDLEDQIENSKTRNTSGNLQQVSKDLDEMIAENVKLFETIQKEREAFYE